MSSCCPRNPPENRETIKKFRQEVVYELAKDSSWFEFIRCSGLYICVPVESFKNYEVSLIFFNGFAGETFKTLAKG